MLIDPAKASEYTCPLKHDFCQGGRCPVWRASSTAVFEEGRPGNLVAVTGTAPRIMEVGRYYGYCGLGNHPRNMAVMHGI